MKDSTLAVLMLLSAVGTCCDTTVGLLQQSLRQLQEEETTPQARNWWDLGMADPILNEVVIYYLGQTWFQGADVSEVLETMSRTNSSDAWSWTKEMRKTAERMEDLVNEHLSGGHSLSAGQASLRAATYYRASLHRHPDPFLSEVPELAKRAVDAFQNFLVLTNYPCKSVRIPYEKNETLPGYFCLNPNVEGPAPTIIFNEGKDGWAEDGKFVVDEAMKRGYHVLLWDGPGMGKTIRIQGLPFRHDWENVLTPVIDFVSADPHVDETRLALVSVSLGGYLGPRAAIFDPRLKALVANPGVMSWYKVYELELKKIDPGLLDLLEADPDSFDATMMQIMNQSDFMRWGMIDSMWHHGVDKPSALIHEIERYNLEGMFDNYTTATLVIDAEAEERGQAVELFEAIPDSVNKKYIRFTAEEAAELHVQPGATAIWSMRTFDWLDDILTAEQQESVTGSSLSSGGTRTVFPALSGMLGLWAAFMFL